MIFIVDGIKKWIHEIVSDSQSYDGHEMEYIKMLSIVIPMIQSKIEKENTTKTLMYKDSVSLSKFTQENLIKKSCILSGEKGIQFFQERFFIREKQAFIEIIPDKMDALIMKTTKDILYSDTTFLLIGGDYGTGKTHMLKLKAVIHAQDTKNKVAYLNLSSIDTTKPTCEQLRVFSLMYVIDKHHFKKHENIDVFTAKDLIDHEHHDDDDACQYEELNIYNLIRTLLENKNKNDQHYSLICIDELPGPSSDDKGFDRLLERKESVCATLKVKTGGIPDKLGKKGYIKCLFLY